MQSTYASVMTFDGDACAALTQQALDEGNSPNTILDEGLIPPMGEVGDLFAAGEFFVTEMLMAARAMKKGVEVLRPIIVATRTEPKGIVVTVTVFGDLHDIGKNLVCMMLEGAGFAIVDLGANCPNQTVIDAVREHQPDIVAMSAMLTTTMLNMRAVIEGLKAAGLRDRVHVMVGGAPVNAAFAREIGADFHSNHAATASSYAREYMEARSA